MNEKTISFITPNNKELFRIPDGGSVVITYPDGQTNTLRCEYLDDYHVKVGSYYYHICEFAERMEQNGNTYAPAYKTPQVNIPEKVGGPRNEER